MSENEPVVSSDEDIAGCRFCFAAFHGSNFAFLSSAIMIAISSSMFFCSSVRRESNVVACRVMLTSYLFLWLNIISVDVPLRVARPALLLSCAALEFFTRSLLRAGPETKYDVTLPLSLILLLLIFVLLLLFVVLFCFCFFCLCVEVLFLEVDVLVEYGLDIADFSCPSSVVLGFSAKVAFLTRAATFSLWFFCWFVEVLLLNVYLVVLSLYVY